MVEFASAHAQLDDGDWWIAGHVNDRLPVAARVRNAQGYLMSVVAEYLAMAREPASQLGIAADPIQAHLDEQALVEKQVERMVRPEKLLPSSFDRALQLCRT